VQSLRPRGRLARHRRRSVYALFVVVLFLHVFHASFHLVADGLGWGYANPLGVVWGPGAVGLLAHAVETAVVAVALIIAIRTSGTH